MPKKRLKFKKLALPRPSGGYFDRFDIAEAHSALESDYNAGGWLQERPSNRRRRESTGVQLNRIGFRHGAAFRGYDSLTENGKAIYNDAKKRFGLK